MPEISNSFDRFLTAVHRQEPDRVPFGELGIDPEVKQAFMGHPVLTPKDEVNFSPLLVMTTFLLIPIFTQPLKFRTSSSNLIRIPPTPMTSVGRTAIGLI